MAFRCLFDGVKFEPINYKSDLHTADAYKKHYLENLNRYLVFQKETEFPRC